MKTIYDHLVNWREDQAAKHELPSNYVKKDINELSNYDFLVELSEAIEDRLEKESGAIRASIQQRF